MLSEKELEDYYEQIQSPIDKIEILKVFQMVYRKGYVAGCNDSGNKVKE